MDLATLTVQRVNEDDFTAARRQHNPMDVHLSQSWTERTGDIGAPLAVTVPAAEVSKVRSKLSQSGKHLGLGVRIGTTDLPDGQVRVAFRAVPRTTRKRKASK